MNKVRSGCVRKLSWKSMKAARTRNLVAVLAIALTALLFTSLFTIAMSINDSFQQANFRQAGGFNHGTFKYMTKAQYDEIVTDPLIKEYGLRRFVGMPTEPPFVKEHVEVSYCDENNARFMYCDPTEGRLPKENTDEAATDTRVLKLLGVEPIVGTKFTMTFDVDGTAVTRTFTLCGFWCHDEAIVASHVLIPHSAAQEIFREVGIDDGIGSDRLTASWNMEVMFKDSLNIESYMQTVLANHGYHDDFVDDSYIATGVNWSYTGSQLSADIDPTTVVAISVLLALIIFTGYLIIYNVFQISVAGDIRFYGLLKTIGASGRQIRGIVRRQALTLSLCGIPLGLLLGWFAGGALTPVVLNRLNGMVNTISVSPLIFVFAAIFAVVTVLLSCRRPGRMASRVSPIEAVRYTESDGLKKKAKKSGGKVSLPKMALANLGRSRGKTAVTIISLSLAVVLLNMTVSFTEGFDMDRYLRDVVSDFILAEADYFRPGGELFNRETALAQEDIDAVSAGGQVADGGRIYGKDGMVQEFITEEYFRNLHGDFNDSSILDVMLKFTEKTQDGLFADAAQIYGMEAFALDKLTVVEGDISSLYQSGSRNIAAVCHEDDYGQPESDSHWANVGDKVKLRYVEEFEFVNPASGKPVDPASGAAYTTKAVKYRDVEYTVTALVTVPNSLCYRYFGSDEYVLNDRTFIEDTGTNCVMLYTFDVVDGADSDTETFMQNYTENVNIRLDYESKATYQKEFDGFRNMFIMLGGALSFIVGLVGLLNFFNAVLTGILSRKRELAMLQSIGMTGRQLKKMLMCEGLYYALGAIALSLGITCVLGPLAAKALEAMFWFFSYEFVILPILLLTPLFVILGCLIPLAVYKTVSRQTIVERLREAE